VWFRLHPVAATPVSGVRRRDEVQKDLLGGRVNTNSIITIVIVVILVIVVLALLGVV
jgi:hypothetical protein